MTATQPAGVFRGYSGHSMLAGPGIIAWRSLTRSAAPQSLRKVGAIRVSAVTLRAEPESSPTATLAHSVTALAAALRVTGRRLASASSAGARPLPGENRGGPPGVGDSDDRRQRERAVTERRDRPPPCRVKSTARPGAEGAEDKRRRGARRPRRASSGRFPVRRRPLASPVSYGSA